MTIFTPDGKPLDSSWLLLDPPGGTDLPNVVEGPGWSAELRYYAKQGMQFTHYTTPVDTPLLPATHTAGLSLGSPRLTRDEWLLFVRVVLARLPVLTTPGNIDEVAVVLLQSERTGGTTRILDTTFRKPVLLALTQRLGGPNAGQWAATFQILLPKP